jgi:hypothetical protein
MADQPYKLLLDHSHPRDYHVPRVAQRDHGQEREDVEMCLLTREERNISIMEGGLLRSIANVPVTIQTSSHSVPSTPSWFGEVTVIAHFLQREARAYDIRGASALCASPLWAR